MNGRTRLALLAAIAIVAAMFLGWQRGEMLVPPAAAPVAERWTLPAATEEDANKEMSFLSERHPWGGGRDKPGETPVGPDKINRTTWRLAGIVERTEGRFALVAIGPPGTANLEYRALGDQLPDGSRLVEITPDSATSEGVEPGAARHTFQLFRGAQADTILVPTPPAAPGVQSTPLSGRIPSSADMRGIIAPGVHRLSQ